MKKTYSYKSLPDTLKQMKAQIIDSLPYTDQLTQGIDSPKELFYFLKGLTTYKNDPSGIELLQTAQTLFENNRHGLPGYGDCDCFTITSISCLNSMGYNDLYVVLAGNSRLPSHVFAAFKNGDSHYITFDLCQTNYDLRKKYKIYQYLPIDL